MMSLLFAASGLFFLETNYCTQISEVIKTTDYTDFFNNEPSARRSQCS